MKYKILKPLIASLLAITIIFVQNPYVFAGLADGARSEGASRPAPQAPSGGGGGGIVSGGGGSGGKPSTTKPKASPKPSTKPKASTPPDAPKTTPSAPAKPAKTRREVTIEYYTTISGNAYEDLGFVKSNNTNTSTNTVEDDKQKLGPISGITVNLLDSEGNVVDTQITDDTGAYCFKPEEAGTYSTEFYYGVFYDNMSVDQIRKALYYNGHDYIAVKTPTEEETINVTKEEIIASGKGAAQVYLAIDCSYSMRDTMVNIDGQEYTRLHVAVDAAKKLQEALINSGDNVYVGLIFFSGTNYRAVSLTKDKESLNAALTEIEQNGWWTSNTDIGGALDKAYDSFYNNDEEDSNRYIAIISDGIPTKIGGTEVYSDESDEEILSKLYNVIAPQTKEKVKEIAEKGVKILSLFTKSDDEEENALVESTFKDVSDWYANIRDGEEMQWFISKGIKEEILDTTLTKEYVTEEVSKTYILAGYEDPERRKEVDELFNDKLNYKNTKMFQAIDDRYDFILDDAKALRDATWMRVVGGRNYAINPMPEGVTPGTYTTETETEIIITHIVEKGYPNQNLVLARRPQFSLSLKTTAIGLNIVLQDGYRLPYTREINSELPIVASLDNELAHGAGVEIEYAVAIKNDSSIQSDYLEIINYLPDGFGLQNISINGTEIYSTANLDELVTDDYITVETYDKYNGKRGAFCVTLDNGGQGENGFYLSPGKEYVLSYTVSKVITSIYDKMEEHDSVSEILVYKDASNRRMTDYKDVTTSIATVALGNANSSAKKIQGIYPGDDKDKDRSEYVNAVYIMPPTGKNLSRTNIYVATAILILVAIGLIAIDKKYQKEKYKTRQNK